MERPTVEDAIARIKDLPTLPSLLGQILATVSDPEASVLDLGKYIVADQSLAATLLKLVNSSYYGFYRQIKRITDAIVILGFTEVRNLALTATAFRAISGLDSGYNRTQLWRHSLAAAMAAERIAKHLELPNEGTFVAGLLHDIGKVVLDNLYPEHFREAIDRAQQEGKFVRETETAIFGLDHAQVGGSLAEHWNLPESIVDAIRYHHQPEATTSDPQLAHLAALANYVAFEGGLGESSNGRPPLPPETSMAALTASADLCTHIAEDIRLATDRINDLLGSL